MIIIGKSPNPKIKIDEQELETVNLFTSLGSIVHVNGGTEVNKARHAFGVLKLIWKSRTITLRTKIRLLNTNVKPALLNGSE